MDQTERAQNELDQYIYVISHDLKAQLRALRMLPDFIAEDLEAAGLSVPDEVRDHIKMLQGAAKETSQMLDALTALSRIGRREEPPVRVSLSALLEDIAGRMKDPLEALDLRAAHAAVLGPKSDLTALFEALLDNARRHGNGQVVVRARQQEGRLFVILEDGGVGIPQAQRTAVFDPFRSLRAKSETGRIGMGLTHARKVVQSLGGGIVLTAPEDGNGCRVALDLPAAD